ncbi:MAG: hypothetical protein ACRDBO_07600 [Lachnospiraceae bacterium]
MLKFDLFKRKEKENIRSDFRKLGIEIEAMNKLPLCSWKRIYNTLADLLNMYPEVQKGFLKKIIVGSGEKMPKYACVQLSNVSETPENEEYLGIVMCLNQYQFKGENLFNVSVEEYDLIIPYSIELAIAHEFGHIIEFLMYFKKHGWFEKAYISDKEYKLFRDELTDVTAICNPLMARKRYGDKVNCFHNDEASLYSYICDYLGSYASADYSEAFADSIAQNYGKVGNPFADEIIDSYHKYYKNNY